MTTAAQIDVIFFDMGSTLRRTRKHTEPEQRADGLNKIIRILGLRLSPKELDFKLKQGAKEYKQWAIRTLSEVTEEELWTKWMLPDMPAKKVKKCALKLHKYWRELTGTRTVLPEARPVLEELFRRGYRLGLISNTTSRHDVPLTLRELGLDQYVEVMVLSTLFGKRKPDPSIFLHAAKVMLVDPEHCAYVGDRPDRDVEGGHNAGFCKTILIGRRRDRRNKNSNPRQMPDHEIRNLRELLGIFPPRFPSLKAKHRFFFPVAMRNVNATWNVSLSSMWMVGRFHDMGECLAEIRRMGFNRVELNHQIDTRMISGADLRPYRFSGIHEPCPADVPAILLKEKDLLISSLNEQRRQQGVRMIKRSINLAHGLGAGVVIVHAGTIIGHDDLEIKLRRLYRNGKRQSDEYAGLMKQAHKARERRIDEHMDAARVSLQELVEYASPHGIKIGIENRYHFMDIPAPDEMEVLLQLAGENQIGFILDIGHAIAMDRMGFFPIHDWLDRFAPRIIGVHIHDVKGIDDHQPPGSGDVDFSGLAKYIPPGAFRTLEVKANSTPGQIVAGLEMLEQVGCISHV